MASRNRECRPPSRPESVTSLVDADPKRALGKMEIGLVGLSGTVEKAEADPRHVDQLGPICTCCEIGESGQKTVALGERVKVAPAAEGHDAEALGVGEGHILGILRVAD